MSNREAEGQRQEPLPWHLGTYYYYRVAAINRKGFGPYVYGNALTADDLRWPSEPRLLGLSNVGRTAATVTWIEPEEDGGVALTGYEYQYYRVCAQGETEGCGAWPQDDAVTKTTSKSVRLSGLVADGEYWFRVRAVNKAEETMSKGVWSYGLYIDLPDS